MVASLHMATRPDLETIRTRQGELSGALEEVERALTAPVPEHGIEWRLYLLEAMAGLLWAFEDHVWVSEAPGGSHDRILLAAPHLAPRISALRDDHPGLERAIVCASAMIEQTAPVVPEALLRACISALLGRLARHRRLDSDLDLNAHGANGYPQPNQRNRP